MSGKRRWQRSKKADREREERDRERAAARTESQERQERIKVLWQELEKAGPNRIRDLSVENNLIEILSELVVLQKNEIGHMRWFHLLCEWAETHAPEKLGDIRFAFTRYVVEESSRLNPGLELTPREKGERKRQGYNWRGVGLIEYEFGGAGEAEWRKQPWPGLHGWPAPPWWVYEATCLDEIFAGGDVHKWRLQELFGMNRARFPKALPYIKKNRQIVYDSHSVAKIMDALLSEEPKQGKEARGAPRQLWLSDPDVRTRVLTGIAARILELSVPDDIAREFLTIIAHHPPDSAKK
jgi:hypothetical protein